MSLTLEPGASRRHYAGAACVTRILAEAAGRSPSGYHQALDGPDGHWAKVERDLTIACARGHAGWAAARVARLSRLVRQARVPLTPALIEQAATADAEEDVSLTRFAGDRSPAHRDELLRRLDREILCKMALRDALAGDGR